FTPQEILTLDRYCRDRFIELVPNQNSFGHLERWLKFPEYRELAECPEGYTAPWSVTTCSPGVLYPDEKALEFLDGLYGELLPNFSSPYFNIGCDETWELGQGRSKERAEQIGKHEVYVEFLLKIFELVKRHGRVPMFWGDIVLQTPEVISRLPQDIIAVSWGYEANHPFARETAAFAESGIPYYVAPGTSAWNSLSGRTANCLGNIQSAVENAMENRGRGMLMTDWGDGGNHQYPPVAWLGLTAGAALAWACEANCRNDWAKAISFYWADDPTGKVGEFLVALGHLPDCFEKPGCNATLYGLAARSGTEGIMRGQCKEAKAAEVDDCLAKLDDVLEILPGANPQVSDKELLMEELQASAQMVRMGLLNLRRALVPAEADNSALRTLLLRVIGTHERLWLARNRAGGLAESSGHFRSILEELE
ncbi:MAG: family 20 glycosylhydrolase, partial [Victivallales bacterium]|nr:family 20 glycosylhydrolase [Victivallales bacterium]